MSDSNARISVTLKGDGSYGAPWVVFHGDTVAEVRDAVEAAHAAGLFTATASAAVDYNASLTAAGIVGARPVGGPAQAAPTAPQAAAQTPPGDGPPTCPHGTKVYKTSKPGAPRAWRAWMCPAPQGTPDQCAPEWLK